MFSKEAAYKELIREAGELVETRAGDLQGTVKGDINKIFENLAKGGKKHPSGAVKLSDGTTIIKYVRTSTGNNAIYINTAAKQAYKITVIQ